MLLNSWLPFYDMSQTLREVDRIFGIVNQAQHWPRWGHGNFPALNVYDHEDTTTLVAECPGVDPDKLELTVLDDTVTFKGERTREPEEGERTLRCERTHGSFSRTITLPDTVDPDSIQAEYNNGVLKVTMKKTATAKPRRIEIQS